MAGSVSTNWLGTSFIKQSSLQVSSTDQIVWDTVDHIGLHFSQTSGVSVSEQCFTSPPTQYRLYGRRFLQVKRPNQQYQITEGDATKEKENNENN